MFSKLNIYLVLKANFNSKFMFSKMNIQFTEHSVYFTLLLAQLGTDLWGPLQMVCRLGRCFRVSLLHWIAVMTQAQAVSFSFHLPVNYSYKEGSHDVSHLLLLDKVLESCSYRPHHFHGCLSFQQNNWLMGLTMASVVTYSSHNSIVRQFLGFVAFSSMQPRCAWQTYGT